MINIVRFSAKSKGEIIGSRNEESDSFPLLPFHDIIPKTQRCSLTALASAWNPSVRIQKERGEYL